MLLIRSPMVVAFWLAMLAWPVYCQDAKPPVATKPEVVRPTDLTYADSITAEIIDAAMKDVQQATDLDDATKGNLREIYKQAKEQLTKTSQVLSEVSRLKASIESAKDDLDKSAGTTEPPSGYDFEAVESLELNDLIRDRSTLEQQLKEAKAELAKLQSEPQRRVDRLAAIPGEIAEQRSELQELEGQLDRIDPAAPSSLADRAQSTLLAVNRQYRKALLDSLENERGVYEAQGELPRLRSDQLTTRVKQIEKDISGLVKIITQRQETNATAEKADAKRVLKNSPEWAKKYAQANVDLIQRRLELANEIREAGSAYNRVDQQLNRWLEDFERTEKRSEVLDADSRGMMLVEKRAELPSIRMLRQLIIEGDAIISNSQKELYEFEDRRADLSDVNSAIVRERTLMRKQGSSIPDDANDRLRQLFDAESKALDALLKEANRNYSLRIASRESQQKLITVVNQYSDFIDRKVFWLPSTEPLNYQDLADSGPALSWLVNSKTIEAADTQIRGRFASKPFRLLMLLSVPIGLLFFRSRLQGELERLGQFAASISCRSFAPTLRACVVTILLAIAGPMALWTLAWTLSDSSSEPVRAISTALENAARWWLMLGVIKQLWRPDGLAEAHFGWPTSFRPRLDRCLTRLIVAGTPLLFFSTVFQQFGDPAFRGSMGRLALIALMLLTAWCFWQFFRKGKDRHAAAADEEKNVKRGFAALSRLAVAIPFSMAVLAAIGFNYSTFQLTVDCVLTITLVLALLVLRAVLFRWVTVARRRIRYRQLVDARQNRAEDEEHDEASDASDIEALVSKEEETDLFAMDLQTRHLITLMVISVAVVALAGIWMEVVPALTPLFESPINPFYVPSNNTHPVTIGALLLATATAILTIVCWRNIPGLVDVVLLGRLGIESSIRYAVTTLSQYAIAIAGALIAFSSLGMSWDQVQWLAAALGVGLGFGLQEIVANFVCGVLLLFERPIRVGDVVTLGETTGVVVRIRSRATTIRNWDRQEVVIPNKELITGRITNWTLSDDLNRITLQVGLSYGSDTDHARELLKEILAANSNVIDDPRPLVTFEQFGDSTLTFVIRAYLDDMDDRLETLHQLHTSVHERFREEGIEIAFPQRDLHVRSIDPSVRSTATAAADGWTGNENQGEH